MKKITKFLFILIVIFSLSLNVILLYDKKSNINNKTEGITSKDINKS